MAALEKLGKLDELSQGSVQVVLANFGEEFIPEQLKIVAELRAAGISTELYLGKEKGLGQQIGYAEARGAKVVVLYGADEQKEGKVAIKNLATKEQVSVGRDQAVGAIGKNAVLTELV
jgi:histidyl-tRNA synthetase